VPVAQDQRTLPEAERGVLLEGRHAAEHSLVHEVRKAPLHRLLDVRAGGVHRLANLSEDRLRKVARLRDVRINSRVSCPHRHSPRKSNAGPQIPSLESRIPSPKSRIPHLESRIAYRECRIPSPES